MIEVVSAVGDADTNTCELGSSTAWFICGFRAGGARRSRVAAEAKKAERGFMAAIVDGMRSIVAMRSGKDREFGRRR